MPAAARRALVGAHGDGLVLGHAPQRGQGTTGILVGTEPNFVAGIVAETCLLSAGSTGLHFDTPSVVAFTECGAGFWRGRGNRQKGLGAAIVIDERFLNFDRHENGAFAYKVRTVFSHDCRCPPCGRP